MVRSVRFRMTKQHVRNDFKLRMDQTLLLVCRTGCSMADFKFIFSSSSLTVVYHGLSVPQIGLTINVLLTTHSMIVSATYGKGARFRQEQLRQVDYGCCSILEKSKKKKLI